MGNSVGRARSCRSEVAELQINLCIKVTSQRQVTYVPKVLFQTWHVLESGFYPHPPTHSPAMKRKQDHIYETGT